MGDRIEVVSREGGSRNHILGTDQLGRDMFSRIIYGARISLVVAAMTLGVCGTIGVAIGLVLVITLGQSFGIIVAVSTIFIWSRFARQVRAEVLQIKNMDYVALAKMSVASTMRILFIHLFPGTINTLIVVATLQVGIVILLESTLSFLGAGVPPPTPAWGSMIADGRDKLAGGFWWISTFPGITIVLTVVSLNLFGDWLRDKLDPRLRQLE